VGDVTVAEPVSGNAPAPFQLRLSQTSSVPVSVAFGTAGETAGMDVDFVAASGIATFQPGQTNLTVAVTVMGDALVESDETFLLTLGGSPQLARTIGRAMILDTDSTPPAPEFASVQRDGSSLSLTWQGAAGRTYRIEYKDSLSAQNWQTLPQVFVGNGGVLTFSETMVSPQRFYRVRVE